MIVVIMVVDGKDEPIEKLLVVSMTGRSPEEVIVFINEVMF